MSCFEKYNERADGGDEREEDKNICDLEGETEGSFTIRGDVLMIFVIRGTIPRPHGVACVYIAVDVQFVECIV